MRRQPLYRATLADWTPPTLLQSNLHELLLQSASCQILRSSEHCTGPTPPRSSRWECLFGSVVVLKEVEVDRERSGP